MRMAKKDNNQFIRSIAPPEFAGALVGFAIATYFLPGGADGWNFFLQGWNAKTTAPAWVHPILSPIALLPNWDVGPFRWAALIVLTIVLIRFAAWAWGDVSRWWLVVFSLPSFWNIWLGQIEFIHIGCAAVGWLIVQKKLHPVFWGLAGVGLVTKFQVGGGLALLFTWWIWRDYGIRALIWAACSAVLLFGMTIIVYPGWVTVWVDNLQAISDRTRTGSQTYLNSALFPVGILAWLLVLMPTTVGRKRRARMVAAATLLGSPYFITYHCVMILTMVESRWWLLISWLPFIPLVLVDDYRWGWLIPVFIMAEGVWFWYSSRAVQEQLGDTHDTNRIDG